MKAIVYRATGDPSVLELVDREIRDPGRGEVRVRIMVSAVNPTDWKSRRGAKPGEPLPFAEVVPNQDGAGVVDAVGPGVEHLHVGDRVWAGLGRLPARRRRDSPGVRRPAGRAGLSAAGERRVRPRRKPGRSRDHRPPGPDHRRGRPAAAAPGSLGRQSSSRRWRGRRRGPCGDPARQVGRRRRDHDRERTGEGCAGHGRRRRSRHQLPGNPRGRGDPPDRSRRASTRSWRWHPRRTRNSTWQ